MTDPRTSAETKPRSSGRREFTWLLLAAVVGAGLVLLGTRQPVARVIVLAPRPLPATVVVLRFADLQPAVAALAVAALASLAAVVATKRLLRRIVALATAAIAVAITLLAAEGVSRADALAAALRGTASSAGGSGAGSATAGAATGSPVEPMTGLPARVLPQGGGWRELIIAGAVLVLVIAITIAISAHRLPVMSSRYGPAPGAVTASARPTPASGRAASPSRAASAGSTMWESLSAGADPTAWPGEDDAAELPALVQRPPSGDSRRRGDG